MDTLMFIHAAVAGCDSLSNCPLIDWSGSIIHGIRKKREFVINKLIKNINLLISIFILCDYFPAWKGL
jgi:hypothetical protein